MLFKRVEALVAKLSEESDRKLVLDLLTVTEQARWNIEMGYGTYPLMRAVSKVYEGDGSTPPEIINLRNWTK